MNNLKEKIKTSIKNFKTKDLYTGSIDLLSILGYKSDKKHRLSTGSFDEFENIFIEDNENFNKEKALTKNWEKIEFLFQITEDEIKISSQFTLNFEINEINRNEYVSYIFMAIKLKDENYARGKLSKITRELNKLFPMPVMILFKIGNRLTFSIINRRPNKIKRDKDVLEKVTLIKDIDILNPHRAHIEILYDLSLKELSTEYEFTNFLQLHNAWQKVLDTSELNKRFYKEIFNWYLWAKKYVSFPNDINADFNTNISTNLIRLLTRLIFVWFIKEKGLVPNMLFKKPEIDKYLKKIDQTESTYYKAILQNLFFATLNLEMNKDKPDERKFVERHGFYSQQNLMPAYRYSRFFKKPSEALKLFENIPFLNGGLFENLDYEIMENGKRTEKRIDCFSDKRENEERLKVPDFLFFSEEKQVDFSKEYDDKRKKNEKVKGIINILNNYKFTVEENTPIEEEIALDPELLGQVFENLLASYNPETQTTARKSTGSYYTPRAIVNYMVDESLIAYFDNKLKEELPDRFADMDNLDELLREFFAYTEKEHPFDSKEVNVFIKAIDNIKILDPACGSGSFPMGILQKLVYLLGKLDKKNELWQKRQIEKVKGAISAAEKIEDSKLREETISDLKNKIKDIKQAFENNELDYGRKLFLIENCIYGVDIQPIAIQISKLRFFISLVIEQDKNKNKKNLGIRALPNLETKFVVANTLIGLDKPNQKTLRDPKINEKEKELLETRRKHFNAITRKDKKKYRIKDENLRNKISELLINDGWGDKTAHKIAEWDPYNQNLPSDFFDKEWMFGVKEGFDIVIANPPFVRQEKIRDLKPILQSQNYQVYNSTSDLYTYFYELSYNLLKENGISTFISSNKWMRAKYGYKLRKFFKENTKIKQIIDFGGYQVFDATVDTNIMMFQNIKYENSEFSVYQIKDDFNKDQDLREYFEKHTLKMNQQDLDVNSFTFADERVMNLKKKIEKIGTPLKDWDVNIKRGITTGLNEAFIINNETKEELCRKDPKNAEIIKPILRGRDIIRYSYDWKGLWIINSHNGLKRNSIQRIDVIKDYPSIYEYLKQFEERLIKRDDQGDHWTNLRNCAYLEEFEKEKIVWREIVQDSCFTWDSNKFYTLAKVYMMTSKESSKYLLAVLNSKIGEYALKTFYSPFLGKTVSEFKKEWVQLLPIPKISKENQQPFIRLVDQILIDKKAGKNTQHLEDKIDIMVYKLYELTYAEVKIVDPEVDKVLVSFGLSKADYERMGASDIITSEV